MDLSASKPKGACSLPLGQESCEPIRPEFQDRLPLHHGLTVGRQVMSGQVTLDHPNVSLRHAVFEIVDGATVLRDLGSANGTFVNGERLRGARPLAEGDRIDIGPFQLTFDGAALTWAGRAGNVELRVRGVSYEVRGKQDRGVPTRILQGVSLHILPSEFVAIIGVNGSGKSTLMNIMAGRALPNEGTVLLNDCDLHANFQALKQDIAFVPQQDVLQDQLTLRQTLDYTAQLRLPPDTTAEQRHAAVIDTARVVDLLDHLDQRVGTLSGGQKKCASLASEVLTRPSLLLLDEVTSGLDECADRQVMRLLRRLADDGVTIVVVTHTLANVAEFCDKVVCMGRGGHITFVGAPVEALEFFAVPRLGGVFDCTDRLGPECWHARYEATIGAVADPPIAAQFDGSAGRPAIRGERDPAFVALRRVMRQSAILIHRNTTLLLSDRRTLVMAAVQSVLIGGLIGYAFGDFGTGLERVNAESALLLLLGLCAIWLGCNAASKDIVGDLAIYRRENDTNLSTAAFIAAKYIVSSTFTVFQLAVVYVLVAELADGIPGDRLEQFALLTIGAMAGTAMGLVISASANTRDQATTIVPLALVPQLILAGVLVPKLPDAATAAAKIAVSGHWLTEAMRSVFITAEGPVRTMNPHTGTLMDMTAEPAAYGAAIVAVHALAFLLIAYLVTLMRHGRHRRSP
jgi:ABC-type multidrug transport system ATPase subunit